VITRLRLDNFKAWREANLTFGSLTGFFGANSAGKSSLLDLLLLLKQTRNATDRGIVLEFGSPSEMVDLGSLADVIHEHDENKPVRWDMEWNLPDSLTIRDPMRPRGGVKWESNKLAISCEVVPRDSRPFVSGLTYRFAETDFRVHEKKWLKEFVRALHERYRLQLRPKPGAGVALATAGQNPSFPR